MANNFARKLVNRVAAGVNLVETFLKTSKKRSELERRVGIDVLYGIPNCDFTEERAKIKELDAMDDAAEARWMACIGEKRCPGCRAHISIGANFCPECGSKQ